MGQRANLIIVQNHKHTLYYSHWCANTITRDLFWGPKHAIGFVRAQRAVDESGWLNDIWAEGGAVVDCDHQVLLLYGGADVLYDVPLRRVYLEMLRRVWRGWKIRWAWEGIADIADYVGHPRNQVLSTEKGKHTPATSLSPPEHRDWTELVGSFLTADRELQLFPLFGDIESYLLAGPGLEDQRRHASPVECVPLDEWLKEGFPMGGFHVDLTAKRLDYWVATAVPGIPRLVSEAWPGWNVTWHRDEYESQLEATAGKLRFPKRPMDELQRHLVEMLLRDGGHSPVETILEFAGEERQKGKDVQINPLALEDDRPEPDAAERQRIVALALGSSNGN